MIIEHLLTMWTGLFMAGYRAPLPVQKPETWLEYLTRAKKTVKAYREEKR